MDVQLHGLQTIDIFYVIMQTNLRSMMMRL
jgi:hypothetical protein